MHHWEKDIAMIEIKQPTPREEFKGIQQIVNIVFLMMLGALVWFLIQLGLPWSEA